MIRVKHCENEIDFYELARIMGHDVSIIKGKTEHNPITDEEIKTCNTYPQVLRTMTEYLFLYLEDNKFLQILLELKECQLWILSVPIPGNEEMCGVYFRLNNEAGIIKSELTLHLFTENLNRRFHQFFEKIINLTLV